MESREELNRRVTLIEKAVAEVLEAVAGIESFPETVSGTRQLAGLLMGRAVRGSAIQIMVAGSTGGPDDPEYVREAHSLMLQLADEDAKQGIGLGGLGEQLSDLLGRIQQAWQEEVVTSRRWAASALALAAAYKRQANSR